MPDKREQPRRTLQAALAAHGFVDYEYWNEGDRLAVSAGHHRVTASFGGLKEGDEGVLTARMVGEPGYLDENDMPVGGDERVEFHLHLDGDPRSEGSTVYSLAILEVYTPDEHLRDA